MSKVSRRGLIALAISAGVIAASVGSAAALAPSSAKSTSAATPKSASTSNVIVLLRNQHTNLAIGKGHTSARATANLKDQSPLVAGAKTAGARGLHSFAAINAFSATVTAAEAAKLASDPSVAAVVPDLPLTMGPSLTESIQKTAKATPAAAVSGAICPSDPTKPILEPEALQVTNTAFENPATPQAQSLVDGTGVKVAYIADGIDINNPDFIRADGTHVFVDYQDFSGDGTAAVTGGAEAFGDASAIASQGRQVYDLSNFVNPAHPLPAGCNITVRGVAPGASLVGLKVFGNANTAPTSRFIEAIDYAVSDGVDVLNESFGGNPFPDNGNDPISLADAAAVAAGVTVVSSTGDAGTNGTNGSPSTLPGVIGVAASTTFRSYIQTASSGAQLSNGTWVNNNISGLSSGGVTQQGRVPDLMAPGDLGWALCTPDLDLYEECTSDAGGPSPIQQFGGTSQSSPLTAGAAALVVEAYKNTHHGARPTPALVQRFITSTAIDQGHPAFEQGSGLLNSLGAVQAAESWKDANGGLGTSIGTNLVVGPTQVAVSGNPGASTTSTITVANVSSHSEVVKAATRTVGKVVSSVNGTDTLNTATAPVYVDAFGTSRSYVSQTFTVKPNIDRLDVSNAAALPSGFSIRIILIDPSGAYAAYSIPQGYNNYSHVDVAAPLAGTWTLLSAASKSSGFNGPVKYNVTQSDYTSPGSVSPSSMTIAAGKVGTFTVHETLSTTPGDVSASVQFSTPGATTSVPLTLRTVIPSTGNTTFSGVITGGNGRAQGGPAQTNIYYLNVPQGKTDLSVGFTFSDPDQIIFAVLTAPDGQVYSFQSNAFFDNDGNLEASNGIQIFRRYPQAGRWILSLNVTNPVSGNELFQSFTTKVAYNTVQASATFPNNVNRKLKAGVPVNIPVTIKNTGTAPLTYFADPRLNTTGTIPLVELTGNATTPLPVPAGINPLWLVPSEVSSLTETAVADQPVNADFFYNSGEPDVYAGANGNGAVVNVSASQVSPGLWITDIGQTGPFSGPAPSGTVTASVSAQGKLFDPSVTSTTDDIWQEGVDPSVDPALAAQIKAHGLDITLMRDGIKPAGSKSASSPADTAPPKTGPITLEPGQTGTIIVTITPTAAPGAQASGVVYIDDFNNFTDGGDEVIAFPYRYTVTP